MVERTARGRDVDVVIIGAGAAGLAAAAELSRHDLDVYVLEARDRIGGRILTRAEPQLPVAIELGAEFVHGRPPPTFARFAANGVALIDAAETHWMLRAGELRPAENLFDELRARLERIARPRHDLPLREFLEGPARRRLPPRLREFAVMLVEGYDAADATRVSTLGTLDEWCGSVAADAPTFRPLGGYSALLRALCAAIDPQHVQLRLSTVVRELRWHAGDVAIDATQSGRPIEIRAARAIVTLPLGILQLPEQAPNAVRFVPRLAAKQSALAGLATGQVTKLVLHFRTPFWEKVGDERFADAAFFHAAGAPFPTFWTTLPVRTSLLTAWAAGPAAARLGVAPEPQIIGAALDCLETMFGGRAVPRSELQAAYLHDWQADPFACGAYSYVVAGGGEARERLARPLKRTLFFAGEAAETTGESGTVIGALASARRAVEQLLQSR